MKQPFYQSHEGITGMTDTRARWARLRIPNKLEGLRVLDIGCNEGLISHWCAQRGAREVIGIDFDKERIEFAAQNYARPGVQFIHQKWDALPHGPFDVILWTSAMHYETDPKAVLDRINASLSPSGFLVLECGVAYRLGREIIPYPRLSDIRLYPTKEFLEQCLLKDFAIREVSPPESILDEPVPRVVYHCRPRVTTVVFVVGPTGTGKTDFTQRYFVGIATKVIQLDEAFSRIASGKYHPDSFHTQIKNLYDPNNLGPIYASLHDPEQRDLFMEWLSGVIAVTDDLVIIEGHLEPTLIERFREKFPRFRTWSLAKQP